MITIENLGTWNPETRKFFSGPDYLPQFAEGSDGGDPSYQDVADHQEMVRKRVNQLLHHPDITGAEATLAWLKAIALFRENGMLEVEGVGSLIGILDAGLEE